MQKWQKLSIIFLVSISFMFALNLFKSSRNKNRVDLSQTKFQVDYFKLDNGMEVLIIPNSRVPAVMHMLWYKVGGIDEKLGKTGLAHYLEHLMFHGTEKYAKDEMDKQVSDFGGSHNAFTSYDFTAYYQNLPKQYLEGVMDMESDRMRGLVLEEEQTKTERNIVLEERLMRRDNSPRAVLGEKIREALVGKEHPYGRPLIGYEDDIEGLTHQDALDFYNKYYFPNNTVLVLAGDITKEEVEPLIEKYYGVIPKGPELKVTMAEEVSKPLKQKVEHSDKNTSNVEIKYAYLAPDLLSVEKKHAYALSLISYLLADTKTSVLYKKLVLEEDLAISVSSSYSDMSRGQAFFEIDVVLKDPKNEEKVFQYINEALEDLRLGRLQKDNLERAKNLFLIETIYSKESYKSLAYIVGMNYTTGISLEEILNWDDNIMQVTKDDIFEAAEYVFQDEKRVIGYLLPE